MSMERMTVKAQEVLQEARKLAERRHHQRLEPVHLLSGCLEAEGNLVPELLEKAGATLSRVRESVARELGKLPEVRGNVRLAAAPGFREVLV